MNLIEQLKQIPDHRSGHGKRYPLWWLLWVVILGSLCGYRGYRPLRDFCQANWESLSEWSEAAVPRTHPSYSTLRRLVMQVDSQWVAQVFDRWCHHWMRPNPGQWIGGDGKSIRCTRSDNQGANFITTVTLFSHAPGAVVAFALMENAKRSEITVVRALIGQLVGSQEIIFTLDALHCQKATVELIVAQQQHYLISVKGNQKRLWPAIPNSERVYAISADQGSSKRLDLNEISRVPASKNFEFGIAGLWQSLNRWVLEATPLSVAQSQELTHGRQVTRTVTLYDAPPEVAARWGNCQRVVWVERRGQRQGKAFCHRSAFITDLTLSAEALLPRIQDRWGIENRLHWVRDVTFLEDTPPRTGGHAPVNWSVLHCWIINLVRQLGYRTLPQGIRVLTNQVQKVSHILLHGFSSA